ncbi:MAG: dihydrolipoyllysine-residue acetyltransferase [Actinomycetota bacterium]|nr:dihydrolipoyllysine-residue acetyltransferase [Actinomycetota bacterium]
MSATLSRVEVPDIGDFDDVPVIEILVAVGDEVDAEDPLVTLESDKATMDVPAPFSGVVKELSVEIGDRVSQGTVLLSLETTQAGAPEVMQAEPGEPKVDEAPADLAAPEADEAPAERVAPEADRDASAPAGGGRSQSAVYASPSVRRLARELGVGLDKISGSGRKGRITKEDVHSRANGAPPGMDLDLAPWPTVDFAKFGEVERVTRSRIQRISGPNLARNWVMIPHVTHNDEADITELESWRKELNQEHAGVKVTMVSFLIVACVAALKEFPIFNSSLDGEELVLKRYYNIGFAADTPGGLVVPVIKGADAKGLLEIARELTRLSGTAREGKLGPADMRGATFTISSLGGIGGTSFTPIINAPEVAILGATRAAVKPVWDAASDSFEPRLMLPLSLSYDHRVIDGAAAARFVSCLRRELSDLRRALL